MPVDTLGTNLGAIMRDAIGWLIEQACRLADSQVCAIANLTDDVENERLA